MQNDCPVMWKTSHQKTVRWYVIGLVVVNLLWIGAFASNHYLRYKPLIDELSSVFELHNGDVGSLDKLRVAIHENKIKYDIMRFLRAKGLSLGQGMDIAEAAVTESKANEVPLDLALSLILTESEFSPGAKSPKGALGLMQIMPETFKEYAQRLGLQVGMQAIYDPQVNIKVGMRYFGDMYGAYKKKYKTEAEARKVALSEYNSGPNGGIQSAYVNKIEKDTKKFTGMVEPKEPVKVVEIPKVKPVTKLAEVKK